MERKIIIGEKELQVRSSLFTIIDYKNTFGSDLFMDVTSLNASKQNADISQVIKVLFQIIYILHKPFEKKTFDEFLNDFDFSILNDTKALEDISNTIGELLGSIKKTPNKSASEP